MEILIKVIFIIAAIYFIIYRVKQKNNFKNYDEYLAQKRISLEAGEYRDFLIQKKAEVKSMQNIRKGRSQKIDPLLENTLSKIEIELHSLG